MCEFGERDATDERIRDQIIDQCVQHNLRRKLLEKGRGLTLEQVRGITREMEGSEKQAMSNAGKSQVQSTDVNKIFTPKNKHFDKRNSSNSNSNCFSCGYEGHLRNDPKCPARGKKCRRCKQTGHFEKMCKTKDKSFKRNGGKVRNVTEQPQPSQVKDDEG